MTMIVNIDRCPGCGIMLDELRLLRAECTEQREAKEAAYAELYKARGFVLADEERRKLTGDALHAERASEHEFNRANALERACAEKDRRIATQAEAIAELTRRRDELESWHGDEKTWRVGAEQERDDAMQRIKALEDDCETAGALMGALCVLATLRPGEKYTGPTDHAAVYAVVSVIAQRDALAVAAKEYLMRSVPDPNTGRNAEETLREILAHLDAEERDEP